MKTIIGVYSNDIEKAIAKAIEIIEDSGEWVIKGSFANNSSREIETDTMIVRALGASGSSRGYKNHDAYIDKHIEANIVEEVIFPAIRPKHLGDGEYETDYRWREHIHYFN